MQTAKESQQLERASVSLAEGMHFVGEVDRYRFDLDAREEVGGRGAGADPIHLLLLGLSGCTGMDVISILRKKRQQVSGLRVEVQGTRVDEHPKIYNYIEVLYRVRGKDVDPKAVERSIELSKTRYCPAMAMLGKTAKITTHYEIEEEA